MAYMFYILKETNEYLLPAFSIGTPGFERYVPRFALLAPRLELYKGQHQETHFWCERVQGAVPQRVLYGVHALTTPVMVEPRSFKHISLYSSLIEHGQKVCSLVDSTPNVIQD